MSETASFVDPVFLARFGLSRINVLDYFLHPLNPFRSNTPSKTSNEILSMQAMDIGLLMQNGTGIRSGPLTLDQAEEEYNLALSRLTGEQYELLPQEDGVEDDKAQQSQAQQAQAQPPVASPLFTIRHVLRSNPTTVKVLGIYYVLEGVIYKAPCVRALMKANVTRTLEGLGDACDALSVCARYEPSSGYTWNFEAHHTNNNNNQEEDEAEILNQFKQGRKKRMRRVLDNRRPGERTDEEEEGIRASEAIDQILVRLSKSTVVSGMMVR